MALDQVWPLAAQALQVLVPFRALAAIGLGAIAYWLLPRAWRRAGLIAISLGVVLLGYGRPAALVLVTAAVCATVYAAVCGGVRRTPIIIALVAGYALLHFLFGLLTFTSLLAWTGLTPEVALPTIGLTAAFTFLRLVHFTADYGRGGAPGRHPRPDAFTYAAWCLFFPTFVHLPLIRYPAWSAQFNALPARPTWVGVRQGMLRIGQALAKGAALAFVFTAINPNAILLAPAGHTFGELFAAALVSAVAYYIGFSAFMDLGIGAAGLYGIALPENFAPVLKMARITRMRDFWRNWNITTTQWLNDYVFTPLGGFRHRPLRNVMLTMIACGLWHSVSLFGAAWGAGLGLMLLIEHGWNRMRIRRGWPEIPGPIRAFAILCGVSLVNLLLTPYGYAAQTARLLYPPAWVGW